MQNYQRQTVVVLGNAKTPDLVGSFLMYQLHLLEHQHDLLVK